MCKSRFRKKIEKKWFSFCQVQNIALRVNSSNRRRQEG
jgi:hypothetical protein